MRITFIHPVVNMSGGIRVIAIYSKALIQLGHQVTHISLPPQKIPLRRKFKSLLSGKGWLTYNRYPKSHLDGNGFDHRVLDRYRIPADSDVPDADVVIATWWETAEWVNSFSKEKGTKVYFVQGHEIFPYLPVDRVRATYYLPFHKVVVSNWLKNIMLNEYGDSNVDMVPNSIDHTQFFALPRGRQKQPTVGFLFSNSELKGVDTALAVIAKLHSLIPDLRVVCFGSHAPDGQFLLEDWIEFHLDPAQDRIKDIYASCDVWLTCSRSEGFNLTAMEAMACCTPIVSTPTGWPVEAIDPYKNGVLANFDDIDAIAGAVRWVLELPESEWKELSVAAYRTVESSSWENSTDLFEMALHHACERAHHPVIEAKPIQELITSRVFS